MRVAIIGAGAAGLAAARHVTASKIECEVFESTDKYGGIWNYIDETENDQYGYPIYSPMYKGLRANLPKEIMGFPDSPFPEQDISFLTQPDILDYIHNYVKHFNLKPLIKFNRMVTEIRPSSGNKWQIKSIDKPTKTEITDFYDYVMVCNGHYREPFIPNILGQEKFKGKIAHSYQYRSADHFKRQRVLVIGGGPSGVDIALLLSSTAKHVVLSHHSEAVLKNNFPLNVTKKSDVFRINNAEEVEFVDGSCCRFDAICFCTGYIYSFPFLHESCGITVDDNHIQPLYKQMVNINRPTMCLIGLPFYACVFRLFDIQARFYCKYITGQMVLPSAEEMRKECELDLQSRFAKGYSKRQAHILGEFQQSYFDSLAKAANITSVPPAVCKLWDEVHVAIFNDAMKFRENNYRIIDDQTYVQIR